jgi:hypothetical protein
VKNQESIQQRFLKDPLPVRLGGLAADLRRISSAARRAAGAAHVALMLEESQYFIEWSAAELSPEAAAQLVEIQVMLSLWKRSWPEVQQNPTQRTLLSIQARQWSDRVLQMAGMQG